MTNVRIRKANVRDCELIVRFLRAVLQDMEAAGGYEVNSDETFWRDFTAKVFQFIQHNDRNAKGLYKKIGYSIYLHEMRIQLPNHWSGTGEWCAVYRQRSN